MSVTAFRDPDSGRSDRWRAGRAGDRGPRRVSEWRVPRFDGRLRPAARTAACVTGLPPRSSPTTTTSSGPESEVRGSSELFGVRTLCCRRTPGQQPVPSEPVSSWLLAGILRAGGASGQLSKSSRHGMRRVSGSVRRSDLFWPSKNPSRPTQAGGKNAGNWWRGNAVKPSTGELRARRHRCHENGLRAGSPAPTAARVRFQPGAEEGGDGGS
jgi:hypothetical protein